MSEKKKEFENKAAILSKTNWSVVVAIVSIILGYFGISADWLTSLAAMLGVEPVALSVTLMATLNVALKIATWAYYKWIKKD